MGRRKKDEKLLAGRFTAMPHYILDCDAYKALPPLARCIYWHLHRLAGISGEKNGALFYSVRSAAADHGVGKNRVGPAFDDLQAKGFIIPAQIGHLGVEGKGKATSWYLTHFSRPGMLPTKDFLKWSPGNDFKVTKKQKPVPKTGTPCPQNRDVPHLSVVDGGASCPQNRDVSGILDPEPVPKTGTYKDLPSLVGLASAASSGRAVRAAIHKRSARPGSGSPTQRHED